MARIEAGKLHLEKQPGGRGRADRRRARRSGAGAARAGPVTIAWSRRTCPRPKRIPNWSSRWSSSLWKTRSSIRRKARLSRFRPRLKGGKIVIGVADRGPGIEENERARIFDKFFRGRRHRFETKGTGMGLAIAKGIVEAHGETHLGGERARPGLGVLLSRWPSAEAEQI